MQVEFERDRTDYVFKGFSVEVISRRFRRIKKVLLINGKYVVTLKTFRKTFATVMAASGLSIQEVANLLGHDSTTTTERYYADVITEGLRKKINSIKKE
jgi:integrase